MIRKWTSVLTATPSYIFNEKCCWTPNRSIRLHKLSDGSDVELLAKDGYSDFQSAFSPDGNYIVWTKNRSTDPYGFGYDIWRMNKDGSSQVNLTSAYSTLQFSYASYSRDGSKIVMRGQTNGGDGNIYIMNADGSALQQLTTDTSEESSPDYGPLNVNSAVLYDLILTKSGTGAGTVISSPEGINCGSTCQIAYAGGSSVTLTANPSSGSTFIGWSGGGCSGQGHV